MLQKTYYKTKDYCKVKFSFKPELAETVEILGLNSDWQNLKAESEQLLHLQEHQQLQLHFWFC